MYHQLLSSCFPFFHDKLFVCRNIYLYVKKEPKELNKYTKKKKKTNKKWQLAKSKSID